MTRQFKYVLGGVALALLGACGGGGGSSGGGFPLPLPVTGSPGVASPPVAVVTKSSSGILGQVLTLDGSASITSNGKSRTFTWTLESQPLNSQAVLADPGSARPSFVLDVVGDYVVRLVVNDGERDSDPVLTTITPVVPAVAGPLLKFAIIETTAALGAQRSATYSACDADRPEKYLADFWPPELSAGTCYGAAGVPSDFYSSARLFLGGVLIDKDGVVGRIAGLTDTAPGVFPVDAPATPVSMSYEASTNIVGLARTPLGRTAGASMAYRIPGYRMVYLPDGMGLPPQRPKASYRIAGAVTPQNAPPGWEAYVETLVQFDVATYTGSTFNSRFTAYSKKFTTDFSEDFEFDLNAVAHSQFTGDQAAYEIAVIHQVAYRRKSN